MIFRLFNRRRVSVDANVLMAAIAYKSKVAPRVLSKIKDRDKLIVSNIILFQCTRQSGHRLEQVENRVPLLRKTHTVQPFTRGGRGSLEFGGEAVSIVESLRLIEAVSSSAIPSNLSHSIPSYNSKNQRQRH